MAKLLKTAKFVYGQRGGYAVVGYLIFAAFALTGVTGFLIGRAIADAFLGV